MLTPSASSGSSAATRRPRPPGRDEVADGVGQVELALGVLRRRAARAPSRRSAGREDVDGRVQLADRALLVGGVALLDDRARPARRRPGRCARTAAARPVSTVSTVTAAPSRAVGLDQALKRRGGEQRRVAREDEHVAVEVARAPRSPVAAASPVPRASGLHGDLPLARELVLACRARRRARAGRAPSARAASTGQSTRRRPSSGWSCFGRSDFIRVPRPAAMTSAASGEVTVGMAGAGGFEPPDHGTKTRCLTAWLRPIGSVSVSEVTGGRRRGRRATKNDGRDDAERR